MGRIRLFWYEREKSFPYGQTNTYFSLDHKTFFLSESTIESAGEPQYTLVANAL